MSDIIVRAQRSSQFSKSESLAAWQRVSPALEALSGLTFSSLDKSTAEAVETQLAAANQITSSYDISAEADFEKLTNSDALAILSRIDAATQLCIDSEAERVMQELATADGKLPVAAIREVREHRDIFVPRLLHSLETAIRQVRNGDEPERAAFIAVFLLTELKVSEAYPIVLDALRLPDDGPFEILGDAVHELVPQMLALFSGGETDEIEKLVDDSDLNLYVRWSAASAYKFLVRDGLLSREVAVDALHRHFQTCIENEDREMLAPLVCQLGNLAAKTSLETIRSAYQRQLVNESVVDLEFIEGQIASAEETVKMELGRCGPTGMPDTIAELSHWAAFCDEPRRPSPERQPVPHPTVEFDDSDWSQGVTTQIRADRKVGRNEPCPCGSGKKFKKCCR